MSWVDMPPCKMIPAFNCINAAILERLRYTAPNDYFIGYATLDLPRRRSFRTADAVSYNLFDHIRSSIRGLYKRHFPVANFGKWSKRHPYGDYSDDEIDLAIAGELASAGIDPAGFFPQKPYKFSDGNFIRACYHLLNNVLIYSLGSTDLDSQYFTQNMKTERVSIETGNVVVTYDDQDKFIFGTAADSRYKEWYFHRHVDRRFVIGETYYPKLQGNWKAKYNISSIRKELLYPYDPDDKAQTVYEKDVGTYEINFSGSQSDFIPWHPLTVENINTYYNRDNDKYEYAYAIESDYITEILINRENLPPPNYQYID